MGVSESRVRAYKAEVESSGVPITNDDGTYRLVSTWDMEPDTQEVAPARTSPSERSRTTRQFNEAMAELEAMTERVVTQTRPRPLFDFPDSQEELVLMRNDDHIGSGNTPVLQERVSYMSTAAVDYAEEHMAVYPDRLWLMYDGDSVTGTDIFKDQMAEVDLFLQDQIPEAVYFYLDEIKYLADQFDEVVCVFQKGNHGRVKGVRDGFNADKAAYEWLVSLIRENPALDNVRCIMSDDEYFVNVEIMGHRFHVRHGQNYLPHVGTSSGKEKARAWAMENKADALIRGHFHFPHLTYSVGLPVFMGGSVTDPGAFEDGLGVYCPPHGSLFTVTKNDPIAHHRHYNLEWIQ